MRVRGRRLAAALILSVAGEACSREPRRPAQIERIDQLLAAVPDSAMRRRWREAYEKGQLPDFRTLHLPESAFTVRPRAAVASSALATRPQRLTSKAIAEVKFATSRPMRSYDGNLTLSTAVPGRLAGQLEQQVSFELLYRFPDSAALPPLPAGPYRLRLRDEVVNLSQRREVVLRRPNGAPLFFQLSDGGQEPYRRRFDDLSLTIEQVAPDVGSRAAARLTLGSSSRVTLRPGERGTLNDVEGPIDVVLLSSYWSPRNRADGASEGDRYHILVLGYRRSVRNR